MADDTAGAGAHTGDNSGGTATPFRVFANEAEFNAFSASIRAQAERKAKGVSSDERAVMETMAAELETRKQRDLEAAGNYDKAKAALQAAADAKVEKVTQSLAKARAVAHQALVTERLRALAVAHGAFDPEDVIARIASRVTLDDDYQVVVADAPSLDEAVADLLKTRPHLAKATGGKGAGSVGGASMAGLAAVTPEQRVLAAEFAQVEAKLKADPRDIDAGARWMKLNEKMKAAATA